MTLPYVYRATIAAFVFGVVMAEPASAQQRRDGSLLPQEESGRVTAVGCLVSGSSVRGGAGQKYVLARPRKGPVASVPEASCTADVGADALDLDNENRGATDAMLGRWVEIIGRLERETNKDPDDLRELDVEAVKLVPVVPPRPAAVPTSGAGQSAPTQQAAQAQARTQAPAAQASPAQASASSSSQARNELPKTASPLPAIGLAGLLSLAAGFALRSLRLRRD